MPDQAPDHDKLYADIAALPHVGNSAELITPETALAAFLKIRRMRSALPDRIGTQKDSLLAEAINNLEPFPGQANTFVVTADELEGIISRSVITASAQTASDVGGSLVEASAVHHLFGNQFVQDTNATPGENDVAADLPPAV